MKEDAVYIIEEECNFIYSQKEKKGPIYVSVRKVLETSLQVIVEEVHSTINVAHHDFHFLLTCAKTDETIRNRFFSYLFEYKKIGNKDAHPNRKKHTDNIELDVAQKKLYIYLEWFYKSYLKKPLPQALMAWLNESTTIEKAKKDEHSPLRDKAEIKAHKIPELQVTKIQTTLVNPADIADKKSDKPELSIQKHTSVVQTVSPIINPKSSNGEYDFTILSEGSLYNRLCSQYRKEIAALILKTFAYVLVMCMVFLIYPGPKVLTKPGSFLLAFSVWIIQLTSFCYFGVLSFLIVSSVQWLFFKKNESKFSFSADISIHTGLKFILIIFLLGLVFLLAGIFIIGSMSLLGYYINLQDNRNLRVWALFVLIFLCIPLGKQLVNFFYFLLQLFFPVDLYNKSKPKTRTTPSS